MSYISFGRNPLEARGYKLVELPNDQLLVQHVNGIALVTLNTGHEILARSGCVVNKVDFTCSGSRKRNWSEMSVSGKRKHGAANVQPDTKLCTVTTSVPAETGTESLAVSGSAVPAADQNPVNTKQYLLRVGVKGQLLEVNERLKDTPDLLRTRSRDQGWLCVVKVTKSSTNSNNVSSKEQSGSNNADNNACKDNQDE